MPWLRELVWFIFSAGGFGIGLLVGLLWLRLRPRSRLPWIYLVFGVVFYFGSSLYAVSFAASRVLTSRFRPFVATDVPRGRTAVVVMGSGSVVVSDWDREFFFTVDPEAAARVLEAVRVYRLIDPEWVVSAGGSMYRPNPEEPSAFTMRNALTRLGVPADRILLETESTNTHDEAERVASILAEIQPEHVVLVTSETHMMRAIGSFRAVGVDVIPAIARDSFRNEPWQRWWLPSDNGLENAAEIAHEFAGIGYYWVRGWYRF
jgi:uncharacterized SAM-binding protein YcdF (DUF218 family)